LVIWRMLVMFRVFLGTLTIIIVSRCGSPAVTGCRRVLACGDDKMSTLHCL
jgi:hypothetical protein